MDYFSQLVVEQLKGQEKKEKEKTTKQDKKIVRWQLKWVRDKNLAKQANNKLNKNRNIHNIQQSCTKAKL